MFGMLQNQLLNLYPDEIQADMYLASGAFYPVVVEGTGTVKGVTVQLPIEMLTKLDAMEGVHRSLFRRKAIRTRHNLVVWCYFADKVHYDQKIESGDYFKEDDY